MWNFRGIATLMIMGLGAVVAVVALLVLWGMSFLMPVPGWVYVVTAGLAVGASFVIGQRLE